MLALPCPGPEEAAGWRLAARPEKLVLAGAQASCLHVHDEAGHICCVTWASGLPPLNLTAQWLCRH